jgi:hypothetical protein
MIINKSFNRERAYLNRGIRLGKLALQDKNTPTNAKKAIKCLLAYAKKREEELAETELMEESMEFIW